MITWHEMNFKKN